MILKSEGKSVDITVLRRSYPDSADFEDGNWLETEIKIDAISFRGVYGANLRVDDFERFGTMLKKFKVGLSKDLEFNTMEEGIFLKGILEMSGNITWNVVAKSSLGKSCLTFEIETDYTSIDDLLIQVHGVLSEYPVIGL